MRLAPSERVEAERMDAHEAEVEDMFVEPDAWRQGVGRRLMEEAERRALGLGARRLKVAANPRAQRFYEGCGFEVIGQVRDAFGWSPLMRAMRVAVPTPSPWTLKPYWAATPVESRVALVA